MSRVVVLGVLAWTEFVEADRGSTKVVEDTGDFSACIEKNEFYGRQRQQSLSEPREFGTVVLGNLLIGRAKEVGEKEEKRRWWSGEGTEDYISRTSNIWGGVRQRAVHLEGAKVQGTGTLISSKTNVQVT